MLQIIYERSGTFRRNLQMLASSNASPYTPFMSQRYKERGYGKFYLYYKPKLIPDHNYRSFKINDLYKRLNTYDNFSEYSLDREGNVKILVCKGCIYDSNGKILLMLSFKAGTSPNYHSEYYPVKKENAENMTLFISTEFLMNPVYSVFYKKLEKGYIQEAFKIELPVIFTTSDEIERLHYSNDFKVEFNQINHFENFLQNDIGKILKLRDSEFATFNPGVGKENYSIPIPEVQEIIEQPQEMRGMVQQMRERGRTSENVFPTESLVDRVRDLQHQSNIGTQSLYDAIGVPNSYTTRAVVSDSHVWEENANQAQESYIAGVDLASSDNPSVHIRQSDSGGLIAEYQTRPVSPEQAFSGNSMIPLQTEGGSIMVNNPDAISASLLSYIPIEIHSPSPSERITLVDDTEDELDF